LHSFTLGIMSPLRGLIVDIFEMTDSNEITTFDYRAINTSQKYTTNLALKEKHYSEKKENIQPQKSDIILKKGKNKQTPEG